MLEVAKPAAEAPIAPKRGPSLRSLTFLRPVLLQLQKLFRAAGFKLIYAKVSGIKDFELYGPFFEPWNSVEWRQILRDGDERSLVPLESKYVLYSLLAESLRNCDGDVAECGVYRGGTAILFADPAKDAGRRLHLFDTFAGMPETDRRMDLHRAGDFADTNVSDVSNYLGARENVQLYPGLIPESLAPVESVRFAFVHIDLDIYSAVRAAAEFFYPRLEPGAVLVFDDYGYPSCPGARAAVDDFLEGRPETALVLSTGQCIVRKSLR